VASGQHLTYTLKATNTGGQDATGVSVTDPLPASAVFGSVSSSQGICTRSTSGSNKNKEGTVTCSLGTLTSGAASLTRRMPRGRDTPQAGHRLERPA
jgi:uncharacterized repeat protein (TIGR01451 family)